jgi:hypothetical protein
MQFAALSSVRSSTTNFNLPAFVDNWLAHIGYHSKFPSISGGASIVAKKRPSESAKSQVMSDDYSYAPAAGQVLLLGCIDPRLLDDVVEFMNHDNLCNRYDQVTLAGAALGALGGSCGPNPPNKHWRDTFFDHLAGAHQLHHIEEVYIIEHRGCGAYEKIFKVHEKFGNSPEQLELEAACHWYFADKLNLEIDNWCHERNIELEVKLFLMDLRGWCKILTPPSNKLLRDLEKTFETSGLVSH